VQCERCVCACNVNTSHVYNVGKTFGPFNSSYGMRSLNVWEIISIQICRVERKGDKPSVSLALPPVGWQSTLVHDVQTTTVCACEKTVVMLKHPRKKNEEDMSTKSDRTSEN